MSKSAEKFARKWAQRILFSYPPAIMSEGQGYSSWYPSLNFVVSVIIPPLKKKLICKCLNASQWGFFSLSLFSLWNYQISASSFDYDWDKSVWFMRLAGLNNSPNSIQTYQEFWEMVVVVFAFLPPCGLESRSRSHRPIFKMWKSFVFIIIPSWSKLLHKYLIACQCWRLFSSCCCCFIAVVWRSQ